MTIDVRARVYCNLGTVVDGQIADSYGQGSGLIRCRGSVRLKGAFQVPSGARCYFSALSNGYISKINRELRALSSFCNPFTNITTVQLGCTLSYLDGRSAAPDDKPDTIFAKDDPINADTPESLEKYATKPISASTIFNYCTSKLGIAVSGIALSSVFSQETFSITDYLSVIDGLIVSEGYCAFINGAGVLQGIRYGAPGAGPVVDESNIISMEGVSSGELPADGVFVRYTSKKLKAPDVSLAEEEEKLAGMTEEERAEEKKIKRITSSSLYVSDATDTYTLYPNGPTGPKETKTVIFRYQGWDYTEEVYDERGRLKERIESVGEAFGETRQYTVKYYPPDPPKEEKPKLDINGDPMLGPNGQPLTELVEKESDVDLNSPTSEYTHKSTSALDLCRRCGYEGPGDGSPNKRITIETRNTYYKKQDGFMSVSEHIQIPYYQTPAGSVAIDREMRSRQDAATNQTVHTFQGYDYTGSPNYLIQEGVSWDIGFQADLFGVAEKLVNYGSKTTTTREEYYPGSETLPSDYKDEDNAANADAGESPTIEDEVKIAWAQGGESSPTIAEYSLPYAPDDIVVWDGGDNLIVIPSNAQQVALEFGRMQNRLRSGNRAGVSLQLPINVMPDQPLSLLFIRAGAATGTYLTNGTSYTFSGAGIIGSTDAVFWGAAA